VRPRPVRWSIICAVCAAAAGPLLLSLTPVNRWLSSPLVVSDAPRRADAIVVLGAGAYDASTVTPESAYRLLRGLQLLRDGHAPIVILSGGGHRGMRGTDASIMRTVALALGIPADAVVIDPASSTTRDQAEAIARIARERELRTLLLVTSPLHSRRAVAAFRRVGLDVISASGPPSPPLTVAQDHLAGRLALVVQALYEHAALRLYAWRGWI
jgi:uncharacterized SAM-binding protein YcdF (DUF218 family)